MSLNVSHMNMVMHQTLSDEKCENRMYEHVHKPERMGFMYYDSLQM